MTGRAGGAATAAEVEAAAGAGEDCAAWAGAFAPERKADEDERAALVEAAGVEVEADGSVLVFCGCVTSAMVTSSISLAPWPCFDDFESVPSGADEEAELRGCSSTAGSAASCAVGGEAPDDCKVVAVARSVSMRTRGGSRRAEEEAGRGEASRSCWTSVLGETCAVESALVVEWYDESPVCSEVTATFGSCGATRGEAKAVDEARGCCSVPGVAAT
jgi:hypothetical protein